MILLAYYMIYILQVNIDISTHRDIILSGKYQPNADEEDGNFMGIEKISEVWPMKPPRGYLSVFIRVRLPNSK
jgi:hypothetical protein